MYNVDKCPDLVSHTKAKKIKKNIICYNQNA